jgi:hypothetical protein
VNRASPLALLLAVGALGGPGCRCERELEAVAHLREPRGLVDAERAGSWRPAKAGAAFGAGEAIRTGRDSAARLEFVNGRKFRLGENALVRFVAGILPENPMVALELGDAELEGDGALSLLTPRGPVRLDPGTRMRIYAGEVDARYEVLVGRAVLGEGKDEVVLQAGDGLAITFGSATMERYQVQIGEALVEDEDVAPSASDPAELTAEPEGLAAAPEGKDGAASAIAAGDKDRGAREPATAEESPQPSTADVTVPAGESAIIHGQHVPVFVRVRFGGACSDLGVVEAGPRGSRRNVQRLSGRGSAVLTLTAGVYRYRLLCNGAAAAGGTLIVRRDAGTARVPRSPPVNTIEADGRKYTILYQNHLPSLTFVWPDPPAGSGFVLHVQSGEKVKTFDADTARHRLASGALGEGEHQWWFTSSQGRSSPRTPLAIRFDNAAVTAQVQTPPDGIRLGDQNEVEVAGIAIQGSSVAVGGAPLPMDPQGRFRGRVPGPSSGERAISVRLEHPRSGVHYYIRRISGL